MKRWLFGFLGLIFLLDAKNPELDIINRVCSFHKGLSCSCADVKLDISDSEIGDFSFMDSFIGDFSAEGFREIVIQTAGCESHFDIDDNENLVPVNYRGYIFARETQNGWQVLNYQPYDIGDKCYKIDLSSRDGLLCEQNYDNANFFLTRILLHTFNRNGSIYSKVIYRGSFGDKGYDDRIKSWRFRDLNGDGKRDIELILKNGKILKLFRVGDDFKRGYQNSSKPHYQNSSDLIFKDGRFSLKIPAGFIRQNAKTYRYHTQRAILQIILQKFNQNLKSYYLAELKRLKSLGVDVKYKRFKNNWFVLSYFNIYGDIVYQKVIKRDGYIFGYKLTYSKNLKREFDKVIKSLNSNLKTKRYNVKPKVKVTNSYLNQAQICEARFKECSFECMDIDDDRCLDRCDRQRDNCYKKIKRN